MPKVVKKEPQPPPTPSRAIPTNFLAMGYAVALRDLAEIMGTTVEAVVKMPDVLAQHQLPTQIDRHVAIMAHKLHRDAVDAVLWRAREFNGQLKEEAPPPAKKPPVKPVLKPGIRVDGDEQSSLFG